VRHNFLFDDINTALPVLMGALSSSPEFGSRAGNTKEMRHVGITLDLPWRREITVESRKANVAAQIVETMWVLAGRNDVETLLPYLPRAADFSDDGSVWRAGYGPRLRDFHGRDQLEYVISTLRSNPGSRQAVISLWDPCTDTTPGKDISCNNWLSFSARMGFLDLHVGIRSNDAMWGWSGINAFEWSVLLEVVAYMSGLEVGALHFSTTSFHLYEQHWAKASRISNDRAWSSVEDSPRFGGSPQTPMEELDLLLKLWFSYEKAIRTGQYVDVRVFPEPMMRSWLQVLQWYWSGDESHLEPLYRTRLHRACQVGIKPVGEPQEPGLAPLCETCGKFHDDTFACPGRPVSADPFLDAVNALHAEKHAAYGDSWKRRGEKGILGNIARKVDRIGSGLDTSDETQADTAVDLMVYLAKYLCWLDDPQDGGSPQEVEALLKRVKTHEGPTYLDEDFVLLEDAFLNDYSKVIPIVDRMLEQSMGLARSLWKG
jgi:thymidylate synthase